MLVIKKKEKGDCRKVQRSCQVHAENGIIHNAEGGFVILVGSRSFSELPN